MTRSDTASSVRAALALPLLACLIAFGCQSEASPEDPIPSVSVFADTPGSVDAEACAGSFETVESANEQSTVRGWAWDRAADAAPDLVIFLNASGEQVGAARTSGRDAPPQTAAWVGVARTHSGDARAYALLRDGGLCPLGSRTL